MKVRFPLLSLVVLAGLAAVVLAGLPRSSHGDPPPPESAIVSPEFRIDAISKSLSGTQVFDETVSAATCKDGNALGRRVTLQAVVDSFDCDERPSTPGLDGRTFVAHLQTLTRSVADHRGCFLGRWAMVTVRGNTRLFGDGTLRGTLESGSHTGPPVPIGTPSENCEPCRAPLHFEGFMDGQVHTGPPSFRRYLVCATIKGTGLQPIGSDNQPLRDFTLRIEGSLLTLCHGLFDAHPWGGDGDRQ